MYRWNSTETCCYHLNGKYSQKSQPSFAITPDETMHRANYKHANIKIQ